jgi:hypothetical protein
MEKIELPDECKALLYAMSENLHIEPDLGDDTSKWLEVLSCYELIEGIKNEQGKFIIASLSQKGKAYLALYPDLKNPSFWDDKHAVIDHVFSLIGLIKPF